MDVVTLELIPIEVSLDVVLTDYPELNLMVSEPSQPTVELTIGGPQGADGPAGPAGVGVPTGGTTRQVLMKNSNTDHDTVWRDETYRLNFTNQANITVTHNLGKRPSVLVTDSTGDEVIGNINHLSDNELSISFSSSFTGTVVCN